ncbi:MAG: S8 family serine peptidase [Phycisphaeraceae bacterium]|nr:S8 family serine peptidase [Phycisphaeraceae bacterium]
MFTSHFVGCAGAALMVSLAPCVAAEPLHSDSPSSLFPNSRESLDGFQAGLGIASREVIEAVPLFHPSQILVRMEPFADRAAQESALKNAGAGETIRTIGIVPGLRVVSVTPGSVEEVCARLRNQPGVLYASPDYVRHALAQSTPYGISLVKADVTWANYGRGGGAKVAVLDTGIDAAHPDLPAPLIMSSFVPGLPVDDFHEHGTHCSGTVLGLDNTIGVVGVAPQASLIIGKVLNNGGYGLDSWIATAIDWAVTQGADVISMSLGGDTIDPALQDACLNAYNAGVLVVAAAGNDSSALPHYPAAFPGVMSIAAVDSSEQLASFSNYGPLISVSAPGVGVQSTVPTVSDTVFFSSVSHNAANFTGSPGGSLTGTVVNCGTGLDASEFPASVSGKIAHIRRGPSGNPAASFYNKATNAVNAGAIGVIISNNTGTTSVVAGALNDTFFIPVFGISQNDGNALQALSLPTVTLNEAIVGHDYASFNGTSMACPHVSGAGGLLIGLFKSVSQPAPLPPGSVRWILEQTAKDLGAPGRDDTFGFGLINVQAAAGYLYGRAICRGDLNTDGLVDDSDFVQFVSYYNDLISPGGPWTGGDFNGDAFADDLDFVEFASSYNNLLCP